MVGSGNRKPGPALAENSHIKKNIFGVKNDVFVPKNKKKT